MQNGDDNDCRHANGVDIGVKGKSEELNQVIAVSVSKIKLWKLIYLVILNLKQRIMI
jgi:hypothetical protein